MTSTRDAPDDRDLSADEPASKTRRKRESEHLQDIGESLITLPDSQLATIPIPESVMDAVFAARKMTSRGALYRQKQYIGKLMRNIDAQPIIDALAAIRDREGLMAARFHRIEQWRDKLIGDGDAAMTEFLDLYPDTDRQRLRQLVRASRVPVAPDSTAPRAARNLFRYLRELMDS